MSNIKAKPFLSQDFESIKSQHLKSNQLFTDDKFLADDSSLYRFGKKTQPIEWKRPYDICKNPQFIVNQIVAEDLDQGILGNCWLIASTSCVLTIPEYSKKVIPENQSFAKGDYCGAFHFRFFQYGEWVDVVVDDRLPVIGDQLVYCHNNNDRNEFFGPLLEKAYAKLNTCYEFLVGGNSSIGFVDMTGGVCETFALKPPSTNQPALNRYLEPALLWEMLFRSYSFNSLGSASIERNGRAIEQIQSNGLVVGHAYSILKILEIFNTNGSFSVLRSTLNASPANSKSLKLILVRNPWGVSNNQAKWKGSWCKGSNEWKQIGDSLKATLEKSCNEDEGEFFISFEDFLKFYDNMDIVHVNLNAMYNKAITSTDIKWTSKVFEGGWVSGKNSGGCGNGDPASYWLNPQYPIMFESKKDNNSEISVIVSLMQTESVRKRLEAKGQMVSAYEALGFRVYCIKSGAVPGKNSMYDQSMLTEVSKIDVYSATREVSKRMSLKPGNYVIIPSLFEKDKNMKFVLRVYYEGKDESTSKNTFDNKSSNKENPVVLPPKVDQNTSDYKQPVINPSLSIDLNDRYNKWFFSGLNESQIANVIKEAQAASDRLKTKL